MKPHQRVASRYMEAKYENLKGNISIEVVENEEDRIGVELRVEGEKKGHCYADIGFYDLDDLYQGFTCADDIEKLSKERWFKGEMFRYDVEDYPVILVVEVTDSRLHEDLQGHRCGIQMYVEVVKEAFLKHGRLPLLFMPNYCNNSSTSDKALRVWKSFARKYHSKGDVIVIDKTPYL